MVIIPFSVIEARAQITARLLEMRGPRITLTYNIILHTSDADALRSDRQPVIADIRQGILDALDLPALPS